MLRTLLKVATALVASACASTPALPPTTQVMVVAAIHSAHKDHPSYGYEDLYATVRSFNPDVVAVEMRQEDMGRDPAYLARNYPLEMRQLAEEYRAKAYGVDWLGSELEGRPVPDNWWREQSWVKRLEREMAADPAQDGAALEPLQQEQSDLVRSATPKALNDGRYDRVTRAYYQAFARSVAGTPYERLASFYRERDERIAANLAEIVARHPGQRVTAILGADHRGHAIDALRQRFGDRITFVDVP